MLHINTPIVKRAKLLKSQIKSTAKGLKNREERHDFLFSLRFYSLFVLCCDDGRPFFGICLLVSCALCSFDVL